MGERSPDIVVIGLGIAGLWTLARLVALGYDAIGIDIGPLGATQSIGSQGIIHGGMKYALTGHATQAARAIAAMPPIWHDCLLDEGELDLSGARTLSPCTYLWTTPGLMSRIAGFAASKVLRTPVEPLSPENRPEPFTSVRGIDVYRVGEPVLDTVSVLKALTSLCDGRIVQLAGQDKLRVTRSGQGGVTLELSLIAPENSVTITPRLTLATAGPGNSLLAESLGLGQHRTQLRPLHMVVARGVPCELHGHCLGTTNLPRLTVTTARATDGQLAWYLGGLMAEEGVDRTEAQQIEAARVELAACLSWIDTYGLELSTCRWQRAEPVTPNGTRPDEPVLAGDHAALIGWPTKLAFAPRLAAMVLDAVAQRGIEPMVSGPSPTHRWLNQAGSAVAIAAPPWERP